MTLVGLGITAMITIAVSKFDAIATPANPAENILTIGDAAISRLPLSTHTFAYMLGYFVFVLSKNSMVSDNALLITTLTLILAGDLYYNMKKSSLNTFMAMLIGIFGGVTWGAIMPNTMRFVPQSYDQSKCNVKKGIYRCRIKRTGEIVN